MSASLQGDPRTRRRAATRRGIQELCCQPRVRLRDRRVTAIEATPGRQPGNFAPRPPWSLRSQAREQAGLLLALEAALRWPVTAPPDVLLRISDGLACSGLLNQTLAEILPAADFPAERLQLEFAETALQGDEPDLLLELAALRDLGVVPVMGGFGGGVSSLSLLRRRSLTGVLGAVKLDAALVRECDSSESDAEFLRGLVRTSHALGLFVIADNIDSVRQFDLLVSAGCDEGVGALFAYSPDIEALS